jgi:hypothetical protein
VSSFAISESAVIRRHSAYTRPTVARYSDSNARSSPAAARRASGRLSAAASVALGGCNALCGFDRQCAPELSSYGMPPGACLLSHGHSRSTRRARGLDQSSPAPASVTAYSEMRSAERSPMT